MKKASGFTLIEVLVTVVLVAILATIAVPSFRSVLQNSRAAAQANELIGALNLARSEAIKLGRTVTICVSSDGATCSGTNWAAGWLVWQDADSDGNTSASEIIKVVPALQGGTTLTEAGGITSVQYRSSGAATTAMSFSLTIPGCTSDHGRTITLTLVGQVSAAKANCP